LALETLYKVCDLRKYDENMEMADPTILMSAYDDISGILFNKYLFLERIP